MDAWEIHFDSYILGLDALVVKCQKNRGVHLKLIGTHITF
jgi:hypothetical protein